MGPNFQPAGLLYKRLDLDAHLIDIEIIDGAVKTRLEVLRYQRRVCRPIAALAHALFQMGKMELGIAGNVDALFDTSLKVVLPYLIWHRICL